MPQAAERESASSQWSKGKQGVAVVIVNYNSGPLLARALDCLSRQTLPPARVIVVDNASSDGSAAGIEARFSFVEVIRSPENLGFAEGNNAGIRAAEGCAWIACLNPDAFPEPGWLEQWMKAVEKLPQYAFFGCKLVQAEGPFRLDGTGDVYHVSGLAWRRDHGQLEAKCTNSDGEIFAPCAAAALYRRDVLLEAGGFDRSFFCYFEDVDLAFRLRLRGHRCYYVSAARVHHMGSAITGRASDFSVYHGHRNLVWAYVKNMPGVLFWLYLPLHLLLNLASVAYYALQGRPGVILRAKRDAIRGLPRVLEARKAVQAARRVSDRALRKVMQGSVLAVFRRA